MRPGAAAITRDRPGCRGNPANVRRRRPDGCRDWLTIHLYQKIQSPDYSVRVWCSWLSLDLAKVRTRVQIPTPALTSDPVSSADGSMRGGARRSTDADVCDISMRSALASVWDVRMMPVRPEDACRVRSKDTTSVRASGSDRRPGASTGPRAARLRSSKR